jgi:FTR1 family protein
MFEALVVTLREGIEAALVLGIIVVYLRKTGREDLSRWAYLGLAAGVAASFGCAGLFVALGIQEEAYEGWLMILGSVFVASMMVWMLRAAKRLKREIESRVEAIASRGRGAVPAGLFGLTFVLILREGVETVLFLGAVALTTDALPAVLGGLLGIVLAALFGVSFVRGTARVDLPRFFKVTAIVLFVLAAQLLIGGLHEFGELGVLPIGRNEMRLIGPIVKNDTILLASLLALPLIVLLVPGRADAARAAAAAALEGPEKRLALARLRRDRLWKRLLASAGILVVASLTLSFAFTRLPHGIDPPAMLEPDAAGEVRVAKAGLDDGHLHRYGVPAGGTVVRFFVMKSGSALKAALDACEVCGGAGYVERSRRLVCLTCAADINTATIGIGGGCNPIPLAYRDEGGELVIAVDDLARQAHTFHAAAPGGTRPPGD